VPQSPQPWDWVSDGVQTPWPVHEDQEPQAQLEVQVRLWVPQSPQPWDWVAEGEQTPSPVHEDQADHWHWLSQVRLWVPQSPQAWDWVAEGEQTPSPVQVDQADHWHWLSQVRLWVPQLPQAWLSSESGSQTPVLSQGPQLPWASQVRVPQVPHGVVSPSWQGVGVTQLCSSQICDMARQSRQGFPSLPHRASSAPLRQAPSSLQQPPGQRAALQRGGVVPSRPLASRAAASMGDASRSPVEASPGLKDTVHPA
jgi:hypothetical protein